MAFKAIIDLVLLGILIIVVFFGYRARWKKRQEEFREELIDNYSQLTEEEEQ